MGEIGTTIGTRSLAASPISPTYTVDSSPDRRTVSNFSTLATAAPQHPRSQREQQGHQSRVCELVPPLFAQNTVGDARDCLGSFFTPWKGC